MPLMIPMMMALLGAGDAVAADLEPDAEAHEAQADDSEDSDESSKHVYVDDLSRGTRTHDESAEPVSTVEVHGLAEAALEGEVGPDEQPVYGAAIHLARLQARFEDSGHFGAAIQVEAAQGTVELLDVVARVGDRGGSNLMLGRFKTPLSDDYLVPAGKMLFPNRGLLTQITTKRMVGAQGTAQVGEALTLRGGIYNPTAWTPTEGEGTVFIGAVNVELVEGLELHVAGTAWLHPEGALDQLEEDLSLWSRQGDAALVYHHAGWTIAAESLASQHLELRDTGTLGDNWDAGALGVVAKRFPIKDSLVELEPAVAWDSLWKDGALTHRASGALNIHKEDWRMVETLAVEVQGGPEQEGLTEMAYLQVQIAI